MSEKTRKKSIHLDPANLTRKIKEERRRPLMVPLQV